MKKNITIYAFPLLLSNIIFPIANAITVTGYLDTGSLKRNINYTSQSSSVTLDPVTKVTQMRGNLRDTLWDYSWLITTRPGSFLDVNIWFTNYTSFTQTFSTLIDVPTTIPANLAMFINGSLLPRVLDNGNDGSATSNNINWSGLINDVSRINITHSNLRYSGPPGGSATLISPKHGNTVIQPTTINNFGMLLKFDISAGDSIQVKSRFDIKPIPIPASIWGFCSGLISLLMLNFRNRGFNSLVQRVD